MFGVVLLSFLFLWRVAAFLPWVVLPFFLSERCCIPPSLPSDFVKHKLLLWMYTFFVKTHLHPQGGGEESITTHMEKGREQHHLKEEGQEGCRHP